MGATAQKAVRGSFLAQTLTTAARQNTGLWAYNPPPFTPGNKRPRPGANLSGCRLRGGREKVAKPDQSKYPAVRTQRGEDGMAISPQYLPHDYNAGGGATGIGTGIGTGA
jgi:hypothetical protein